MTVATVSWVSPRTLTRVRVSSGKPGSSRTAATRPASACAAPDHSRKSAKTPAPGRDVLRHPDVDARLPAAEAEAAAGVAGDRARPSIGAVRSASSPPISEAASEASSCERARSRDGVELDRDLRLGVEAQGAALVEAEDERGAAGGVARLEAQPLARVPHPRAHAGPPWRRPPGRTTVVCSK